MAALWAGPETTGLVSYMRGLPNPKAPVGEVFPKFCLKEGFINNSNPF
jgi:hypothetical protein